MNENWYEVWADEGHEVPYLLLLRPTSEGRYEVLDPKEGNRRAHDADSYETAKLWLLEDEFVFVGRKILDE